MAENSDMFSKVSEISEEEKGALRRQTAAVLPDSPAAAGMPASAVKPAFWRGFVGDKYSLVAFFNRMAREMNVTIDEIEELFVAVVERIEGNEAALDEHKIYSLAHDALFKDVHKKIGENEKAIDAHEVDSNAHAKLFKDTRDYVDAEIAEFDFIKVVDALPDEGLPNKIYLVPKEDSGTQDLFDEYVWVNKGTVYEPKYGWEFITTKQVEVDLTPYVPKTRTINGNALTSDITLCADDVGAAPAASTPVTGGNGVVLKSAKNSAKKHCASFGYDVDTSGQGSLGVGYRNYVRAFCGAGIGADIKIGDETESPVRRTFGIGEGLISTYDNQLLLGKWNKEDSSAAVIIGGGEDYDRKNIYTFPKSGTSRTAVDTDVVNVGSFYSVAKSKIPNADSAKSGESGLMTKAQSDNLETLVKLLSDGEANTTIDTINEVLNAFANVPGGTDMANVLAAKANKDYVDNELAAKANKDYVDDALTAKASYNYVDGALGDHNTSGDAHSNLLNRATFVNKIGLASATRSGLMPSNHYSLISTLITILGEDDAYELARELKSIADAIDVTGIGRLCVGGSGNIANGSHAVIAGGELNQLRATNGFIGGGKSNRVKGEGGFASGYRNELNAMGGAAIGADIQIGDIDGGVRVYKTFGIGQGLLSTYDDQLLLGKWNDEDSRAAVIIGGGEDYDRKNIYTFPKSGASRTAVDTDVVNVGSFYEVAKSKIPNADSAKSGESGLMTKTQSDNLKTLVALLSDSDANTTIDTIKEVLNAFANAPEGTNIANALAEKASYDYVDNAILKGEW